MMDLQNLPTGSIIYYLGKKHVIKDWFCFKDKQFTPFGFSVYALPVLEDGSLLDWLYWGDVETLQGVIDAIGEENLR